MPFKTFIISLMLLLMLPASAGAQRGGATWDLLGEQRVGFRVDNDSIQINQDEAWYRTRAYRTLRFTAERADVHLISLRVHYINGYAEDIEVDRLVPSGGQVLVDLKGERSYLKQIDMRYRSRLGLRIGEGGLSLRQAVVRVYGERVERRPDAPLGGGGWVEIDRQRFDRSDAQVTLTASRWDGRFGQIRLRSLAEPVSIQALRIRFRNGDTQVVRLNARLGRDEQTAAIDLVGVQRMLESVVVVLDPRRRPGMAELQLVATRRPGESVEAPAPADPYAGRGWVLLGQSSVGLLTDRDVIDIGQPEEWFRSRGFRALNFVAERNDVHLMSLRIVYLNGYAEDLSVDRLVRAGTDYQVDLRGERSYIRRIEMVYRSRPGLRGQAVVKVFGEPIARR